MCLDDASRNYFRKVMKSERQGCAVVLLKAALATSLRVKVLEKLESARILPFPDGGYGWDASLKARTDPS